MHTLRIGGINRREIDTLRREFHLHLVERVLEALAVTGNATTARGEHHAVRAVLQKQRCRAKAEAAQAASDHVSALQLRLEGLHVIDLCAHAQARHVLIAVTKSDLVIARHSMAWCKQLVQITRVAKRSGRQLADWPLEAIHASKAPHAAVRCARDVEVAVIGLLNVSRRWHEVELCVDVALDHGLKQIERASEA